MKRILPLAVLLLVAAGAAAWWYGLPERLGWLPEARREFVLYGNVDIRQVSLGFRVSGRVSELRVDEGDLVKSGTVLAKLDAAPYELAVRSAEANAAALRATLDKLKAGPRPTEIAQRAPPMRRALLTCRMPTLPTTAPASFARRARFPRPASIRRLPQRRWPPPAPSPPTRR